MIYGYIRVSTDKQSVENQRYEIRRFCRENKMKVDGRIEETISGTTDYDKRELGKLLAKVRRGDLIICSELSRLGRSLFMIMEILNHCMNKECKVWTVKDGYRLGDDIPSKVLAFAFGLSAEIERKLISERTREALVRRKSEGFVLGRPEGAMNVHYRLDDCQELIGRLLQEKESRAGIARACGVSKTTLLRWLKRRNYLIDSIN